MSVLPPTAGTATQRQLSHADKLRKVISELVETEKTYVKVSRLGFMEFVVDSFIFMICFLLGLEVPHRALPETATERAFSDAR